MGARPPVVPVRGCLDRLDLIRLHFAPIALFHPIGFLAMCTFTGAARARLRPCSLQQLFILCFLLITSVPAISISITPLDCIYLQAFSHIPQNMAAARLASEAFSSSLDALQIPL
jgi:hypothetical protein